jgi:hypothetical protein
MDNPPAGFFGARTCAGLFLSLCCAALGFYCRSAALRDGLRRKEGMAISPQICPLFNLLPHWLPPAAALDFSPAAFDIAPFSSGFAGQ